MINEKLAQYLSNKLWISKNRIVEVLGEFEDEHPQPDKHPIEYVIGKGINRIGMLVSVGDNFCEIEYTDGIITPFHPNDITKWLPIKGEQVEVSDDGKEWIKATFNSFYNKMILIDEFTNASLFIRPLQQPQPTKQNLDIEEPDPITADKKMGMQKIESEFIIPLSNMVLWFSPLNKTPKDFEDLYYTIFKFINEKYEYITDAKINKITKVISRSASLQPKKERDYTGVRFRLGSNKNIEFTIIKSYEGEYYMTNNDGTGASPYSLNEINYNISKGTWIEIPNDLEARVKRIEQRLNIIDNA